ncbi:MAG: hypothetical protein AB1649_20700 [Chloroflexota bacterium]
MLKYYNPRLVLAWMLSLLAVSLVLGFFGNFYSAFFEFLLLTVIVQTASSLLIYHLVNKAWTLQTYQPANLLLALALVSVLFVFVRAMLGMAMQFPALFDADILLFEERQWIPFALGGLIAIPILGWVRHLVEHSEIRQTRFYRWIDERTTGLLPAGFFFVAYFIFASVFNRPAFDVDDIFFDTDGLLWRMRFTTPDVRDYYWRAVHPFVLIIIRPIIAFIAFFLKGDRLAAAFLLVAFAGASCVFLTWRFVKTTTGNSLYALLIASMLGASAAHLVFSSLIETYIFLAAVMLAFLVLLLRDTPLFALVATGLISFGITLTNFIQTAIAFIFVKRDFKGWVKYGVIVAALTIPLTMLNDLVYPNSQPYFFIPSSIGAEAENTFTPTVPRALAVGRVMALHSMVAPDPLILEEEIPFLKVWIFKADPLRLSEYETGFGLGLTVFWVALLLVGGFLFLRNLRKADNRFQIALIFILLFNFALHLRYGKDVFLYSTNWTYAIVLFLALAWKELADKRWFQITLLVFVALLLANNSRLIYTMLSTAALHIR